MKKWLSILITLLTILALFWRLNTLELRAEEPRRAAISMEMLLTGEYLVPHLNGQPYYNKPPLFNWVQAGTFKLTHSFDEWAARLPSLLSLLLTMAIIFGLTRPFLGASTAFLAAMGYPTSVNLFWYGSVNSGEIDLFYSLIVVLQAACIFWGFHRKRYFLLFAGSYCFMAIGILTKGLPSVAFQALTLLAMVIFYRKWALLWHWTHVAGLALGIGLVVGYFYQYHQTEPWLPYVTNLLGEASGKSAAGGITARLANAATLPLRFLQLLLPWSLALPLILGKSVRHQLMQSPLLRFCLLFTVANLIPYLLSADVRNRYLYMFLPFLSIVLAYGIAQMTHHRWYRFLHGFWGVCIALLLGAALVAPWLSYTASIDGIIWKAVLFGLGFGLVLTGFLKQPALRVYLFLLAWVIGRMGFSEVYLPLVQERSDQLVYRTEVAQLTDITGKAPVYLMGVPHSFTTQASWAPAVALQTAPLIAYQIPYYLTRHNQHLLRYDTIPHPGAYYLMHESMVPQYGLRELDRIPDRWLQHDWILGKMPALR